MEKNILKKNFPLSQIRRYLEPGPIVLVSSAWKGERDVMTMGWHMMLEFTPALFACCISEINHSFGLIRKSRECVINLPTAKMARTVAAIGNCSGADTDKFARFGLTPQKASKVGAPLIRECFANFECKLHDGSLINRYNLFIWEVVKAHVAKSPPDPQTIHYRGDGRFMVSGRSLSLRREFKPQNL